MWTLFVSELNSLNPVLQGRKQKFRAVSGRSNFTKLLQNKTFSCDVTLTCQSCLDRRLGNQIGNYSSAKMCRELFRWEGFPTKTGRCNCWSYMRGAEVSVEGEKFVYNKDFKEKLYLMFFIDDYKTSNMFPLDCPS